MNCTSCGAELREGAKFCTQCGAKVLRDMFCGQCGTRLGAGDAFCPECGAPVGGAVLEKKRRERKTIAAGLHHTLGLKNDGTVLATTVVNVIILCNPCDVSCWRDIVAIAAGGFRTVGLKADGTVLAVGDNDAGQCDVFGWRDIIAVDAGVWHTVGLKTDGTVLAVGRKGWNSSGQCEVSGWRDIPYRGTEGRRQCCLHREQQPWSVRRLRLARYQAAVIG